jgi:D-3-phosphoglycerate dehydrogenase
LWSRRFGRIARRLCEKVRPLGLQVLTFDPYAPPAATVDLNARWVGLAELLERRDFAFPHAPSAPETLHLLAARRSRRCDRAFVINVSRGGLVDQSALAHTLRHGTLAGAPLDVLESEPPMPDDPILAAPNLLLTPHVADYFIESFDAVRDRAIENIIRVPSGQDPLSAVNRLGRSDRP